jgi:N-acetylmuramic acid 6-phosphate etherase
MDHLLTEARNPASQNLDTLSALELVHLMNSEDARIIPAVRAESEKIAQAMEVIADRLRNGGRLVYGGAGTSGRLGVLDASECPPTFNSPPGQIVGLIAGGPTALTTAVEGAEDHPEYAIEDLQKLGFSSKDVFVGIATSGRTPYVIGGLQYARSLGAFAIGFACVPNSEMVPHSDLMIAPLVGPEVVTGSTRLKSGTATKLVLNMLTTGAMVLLGKTYGNLMVDLRATNVKLKARTNRIVRHFLNTTSEEATELLDRSNGELKTALVVGRTGLDPDQARERLRAAGGVISKAFGTPLAATLDLREDLLIGIDGGGTSTSAILAQKTPQGLSILGRGQAGPSNIKAVGMAAYQALDQAIEAAFRAASLPRAKVGACFFGLAGAGRPADQAEIMSWATKHQVAEHVRVDGDMLLPLGMLPQGEGIAVICGTGSCVVGKNSAGTIARSGGWGPLLGDEGSAYILVLQVLQAIARANDGYGPKTALTDTFLKAMSLNEASGMVIAVHSGDWDRQRLAGLAPLLFQAAESGDSVAQGIIDAGAQDLAATVVSVVQKLGLKNPVPLALTGGMLLHVSRYRELFLAELKAREISQPLVLLVPEPAEGALRLAAGLVN